MKRQILLLLSIITCTFVMAQMQPSFGIRAGLSTSGMQGDAVKSLNSLLNFSNGMVTTTSHTGFFAGTYATLPFSEKVSLEPALYYTQKGGELKGSFNLKAASILGVNAKAKLNLQYIDVPVLLKTNFGGFQLFAGPEVSYLVNADLRTTAGALGFNVLTKSMDVTPQFNRWDAGITGGIGYQFASGFNIMAAYDHGLSRVDANKSLNSYNHSVKVGIGISF